MTVAITDGKERRLPDSSQTSRRGAADASVWIGSQSGTLQRWEQANLLVLKTVPDSSAVSLDLSGKVGLQERQ